MPKYQALNITDSARHAFTDGIFNAITHDLPDRIHEDKLPTALGSGLYRWNYLYRNVTENLGSIFQVHYAPRGAWKALILYDPKTELTFSIMSEKNLTVVQKKLWTGKQEGIHYIDPLVSTNIGYDVIEGQMMLEGFEIPSRDQTAIEKLREQLLSEFVGIIKNHMLILFDYAYNKVLSVRAVLLTPTFEIAFSESWNQFLDKPYSRNSELVENSADDSDKPLVSIKKDKDIANADTLIALPEISEVSGA